MENFVQGSLWRNKVKNNFADKTVFPLFVYFDDYEINNPLWSHKTIHKLGAVYYSIPCLPPEVNSLIENIFVGGSFHSWVRCQLKN